jgi:cyclase
LHQWRRQAFTEEITMDSRFASFLVLLASLAAPGVSAQEPVWDGNKVELVSEQIAEGVFAVYSSDARALERLGKPVATSGGFIVGQRKVLLIETMLNQRLYKQLEGLVGKVTQLPISFAVNTSAHGDHSFGNMYLPAATAIIQHQNTSRYISQHLEDDKAFMIKYFGAGRGIEPIQARAADVLVPAGGRLSLDLGGKTVDIIDFGFAQTGGDLFVWEPRSRTMWTGNPVIAVKPALPWLLDGHLLETLATLKKVMDFLPADAKVVPGHGTPISREDIKWHVDYLEAVRSQVKAAIGKGLSLEETVKTVTMPEFSGYALFGWVHPGLNVPAAYKDLAGK